MPLRILQIGISVAVERDWVTCIAHGDGAKLTQLNTCVLSSLMLRVRGRRSEAGTFRGSSSC